MASSQITPMHFLRSIIDSVADPIFVKDQDHRWVELNRAFCEFMGHSREVLLGKSDYDFFPRREADVFWKMDDLVFKTGEDNLNEEDFTDAEGVRHTISTKKSVFVDSSGRKILVGIIRDITELREAERRNLALSKRMAASAKFAALGEMASGIAHEINTPLAIIQASADELLDVAESEHVDAQELMRIHERIDATVARVSRIISGLRAFARDANKDEPVTVTLSTLIKDTLGLCGQSLRNRGIELRIVNRATGVSVSCRATQIVQILINLLNNARDAVHGTMSPWIELSLSAKSSIAELRVKDSGPGIPEAIRDRVMEPFFTTKAVGAGTGIGLSVARGLAEDNGGTLTLDAECPSTCFVLQLPRVHRRVQALRSQL